MPARVEKIEFTCEICSTKFYRVPSQAVPGRTRFCSPQCRGKHSSNIRAANMEASFVKRFWDRVKTTDTGCMEWQAGRGQKHGYGWVKWRGRDRLTHVVSMILSTGEEIPEGLCVLHKCDNRPCVNPDHLYIGTRKDNGRDASERKRFPSRQGIEANSAKLSDAQIKEIRSAKGVLQKDLAMRYGVSQTCISSVLRRKSWEHVE